jgi:hypothetical protein
VMRARPFGERSRGEELGMREVRLELLDQE